MYYLDKSINVTFVESRFIFQFSAAQPKMLKRFYRYLNFQYYISYLCAESHNSILEGYASLSAHFLSKFCTYLSKRRIRQQKALHASKEKLVSTWQFLTEKEGNNG
jgi:hypothetical protein